jgi:hypothetical protein
MTNPNNPNGFSRYRSIGTTGTYEMVEAAVSSSNTVPIFQGDPVCYAAGTTGLGTGFVTQAYPPVVLTVGATGIATGAGGALTVTFTAAPSGTPASPNAWAPPIGSKIVITGSTTTSGVILNGVFDVTSSTTTTAVASAANFPTPSITSTASGTVTLFVPVAGIFNGCKYLSVAQKRTVWLNYWPGSDANTAASVTGYIENSPQATFSVQTANSNTTATGVTQTYVGQNIGFNYPTTNGNTATGLSTAFADQYTLTNPVTGGQQLYPFRIISVQNYTADGSNPLQSQPGNDYTLGYNRLVVAFNNAMLSMTQLYGI